MKKPFTLILLSIVYSLTMNVSGQNIPEVLYYKFDGTGVSVPNYSSSPPAGTDTATIMGSITQGPGTTTICSGTLIGSGNASSTDYLNTNWAPNVGFGSWTISFRTSGISTNSTLYYIFGDPNTADFRCFTNGIAGSTNWVIRGAGLIDVYINGGALSTPTMCTYVYDNVANTVQGYLNGTLVTSVAQSPGAVNLTGTGPFKVMGRGSSVGAPLGGQMDEFRLYSRALTGAEVMELYNPYATTSILSDTSFVCPGDTMSYDLSPVWPISNVLWSNGSTADTTVVSDTGYVYVALSGACATGYDSTYFVSLVTSSSISPTSCGFYMSPSGDSLMSSGIYMDTIANFNGCDSLITINLTVNNPSSSSISPTICSGDSYLSPSGNSYSAAGTYMDTIPNFTGCDSLITVNLGIITVDVSVTQTGVSGENLNANTSGASYQWVNCPGMGTIGGQTSQGFTASSDGLYGVIITENGCTDTSACYTVAGIGIDQNTLSNQVKLYPNPTNGTFNIDIGTVSQDLTIELINNVGQVIRSSQLTNTNIGTMTIDGANGLYFVRITNASGEKVVLSVVKE